MFKRGNLQTYSAAMAIDRLSDVIPLGSTLMQKAPTLCAVFAAIALFAVPSVFAQKTSTNSHAEIVAMQKSAAAGNPHSQCLLGISYLLGKGVPQDCKQALQWLQKSADRGQRQAQNALGLMYRDGKGVSRDTKKAELWFKRAADQGDQIALANLKALQDSSGNFRTFEDTIMKTGLFKSKGEIVNGVALYQSKEHPQNVLSMRSCSGYCCEGVLALQPMEDEDLELYLLFLYAPLQQSLYLAGKDSVAEGFKGRVSLLREKIFSGLAQSNLTEFSFDGLNVRAQCDPLPESEIAKGKLPQMILKLWVP